MRTLFRILLVLFLASPAAFGLDVTINLLNAEAGSWTRRLRPNGHSTTEYVQAVEGSGVTSIVTLQLLRHHDGHVIGNRVVHIPGPYIAKNGIGLNAREGESITHNGHTFPIKIAEAQLDGASGVFYLSDDMPGNGIVRLDIRPNNRGRTITLWTAQYGREPDELILNSGPGQEANEEYGIPMP